MTITKTTIMPPKMAGVLLLPDGGSVSPCVAVPPVGTSGDVAGMVGLVAGVVGPVAGVVGPVAGGCVTTTPVKQKRLIIGHCYWYGQEQRICCMAFNLVEQVLSSLLQIVVH